MLIPSLVILLAAMLAVATGFGFNLLSVPLLILIYAPLDVVVVTLLLGSLIGAMLLGLKRVRQGIDWSLTASLFLSSLAGMPFGFALLLWGPHRVIRLMVAVLTASFALLVLTLPAPKTRLGRRDALIAGFLGGFLSTSTSMNGPPVAFYLLGRNLEKNAFRANMITYVFLATLSSVVMLAIGRAITPSAIKLSLELLPSMLVGFFVGLLFASKLTQRTFEVVVLVSLLVVGLLGIGAALR